MKRYTILTLALLAFASMAFGQAFGTTGTTNLTITVGPELAIRVDTATTPLTNSGGFSNFTGTTNYSYKVRTGNVTTANIKLQVTTDFSPASGPSLGSGDVLTYACTANLPATACSGTPAASTSSQTSVATFPSGAKSNNGTGSVAWTLVDNPNWEPGAYQATVTFTASLT